jgi:hypothetical protein
MVFIKKKMINKLFKILVFVLVIEIVLGYGIYFRNSALISGNYVSSTLRLFNKIIRFTKPITEKSKEENKIREINKIDCKKFEEKNQILNISGFNSYRKPIKFQSNLNFLNTFDQEKDFLIVILGNSETFGWYQKDEDRLHSMIQKKLRDKINTKDIFVLNLSYAGGMISDHLTDTLNFSEIYHPDLVIFYTGGNELHLNQTYREILDNYSLNTENLKLYSFEKKNDHNSSALLFPNTLQKCLSDSLYLTKEKFKKINQNINVEMYIKRNFEKINISLKSKSIDFLFYIQPINKEISKSKKTNENYKKITSLSIPDKSFKNLNLIDKKIKINYVDRFHTLDTNNISNYLVNDILIKFEETIKDKIINENN